LGQRNSAFYGSSTLELTPRALPAVDYDGSRRSTRVLTPQAVMPRAAAPRAKQKVWRPYDIWGHFNNYRKDGVTLSASLHVVVIGLLVATATPSHQIVPRVAPREVVTLVAPSPQSYAPQPAPVLPAAPKVVSGGGGGGDRSIHPAPKGRLPKLAMVQITPPAMVVRNEHPRLTVEPTVVVPPQVRLAENHMPNLGTAAALAMPMSPPSNGTGSGGGIGSGLGGGVGEGHGPGLGAGSGGGVGGGVFHVGGGVSAPLALSTPDPEYTEEARKAKTQGTCVLGLIVDAQGHPRDIRVVRGLGSGLDQKAVEAVRQWRFQPAVKDGNPVNVQISVEVVFKLY